MILSITWGLIATLISTFLPLIESRDSLWRVTKNLFTCAAPTVEEEGAGDAVGGDFAKVMYPAPSFAAKVAEGDNIEKAAEAAKAANNYAA